MSFKDQIAKDNKLVFMNVEEFGEMHFIDDKEMPVLIDNNELVDREKRYRYRKSLYGEGLYLKELLIYVRECDFGKLPAIGRVINFDGKIYKVADAINEDGIYSLCLEMNRT